MEWFQRRPTGGVLDFAPLTDRQRKHLTKTHATLAGGVLSAAGGVYMGNYFVLPHFVAVILILGLTYVISSTHRSKPGVDIERSAMFFGLAALCGNSSAPYIIVVSQYYPSVLPTALAATLGLFASLSCAAIFAKQRSLLYLGGIIGPVMMYTLWASLFNTMIRSEILHNSITYITLFAYLAYILYDTQIILEMARTGDINHVTSALIYFFDLFSIFLRITEILVKKEDDKKKRRQ